MVKGIGKYWYLYCLVLCLSGSCDSIGQKEITSPEGYDFSAGKKHQLFSKLREISGIAFLPGSDTSMLAVNDEEGRIYAVNINAPEFMADPTKFSGKGDYEDIAFFKDKWRVLESNGLIHSGNLATPDWTKPPRFLPKDEYEAMAACNDSLVVICKECKENKEGTSTVFFIKADVDSLYIESTIQLEASDFIKGKNKQVLASALARHPITREWFILSHLNGSLLIADAQFKVKQSFKLPRSIFLQPEGIAFSANGDLFISNEGDTGQGYILEFAYGN